MKRIFSLSLLVFASCGHFLPIDAEEKPATQADIVKILNAIGAIDSRITSLEQRLTVIESRVSHGEQFAASKAGYRPLAAQAVAAPSVPPTTPATTVQRADGASMSFQAGIQTGRTVINAPATVQYGGTNPRYRSGPLGLIKWRVGGGGGEGGCGYLGCGGADPTPEFRSVRSTTFQGSVGGCPNGQCPSR